MPDEAEAHALLALMLINHARSTARFLGGELVLLDDQDRALWDQNQIDEGRQQLERALTLHGSGPYIIQAAITDIHLQRPRNWEQIALLYQRLEHITSSPVVTMNRAIAVAELEGPEARGRAGFTQSQATHPLLARTRATGQSLRTEGLPRHDAP